MVVSVYKCFDKEVRIALLDNTEHRTGECKNKGGMKIL